MTPSTPEASAVSTSRVSTSRTIADDLAKQTGLPLAQVTIDPASAHYNYLGRIYRDQGQAHHAAVEFDAAIRSETSVHLRIRRQAHLRPSPSPSPSPAHAARDRRPETRIAARDLYAIFM
jgi:hypothetical protein